MVEGERKDWGVIENVGLVKSNGCERGRESLSWYSNACKYKDGYFGNLSCFKIIQLPFVNWQVY